MKVSENLLPRITLRFEPKRTAFTCLVLPMLVAFTLNICFGASPGYAYTGWDEDGEHWYYTIDDEPANGWQGIYHSGIYDDYYFVDGTMQTGWLAWDDSWFYLADGYGQNIDFYDTEYGTCRMGWQSIWHSSGYSDWYYFWGNGSGRMATGWLSDSGYDYYLADDEVDQGFYNDDYGVCLKDFWTIGVYNYVFKSESTAYTITTASYPIGAMLKNIAFITFIEPGTGATLGLGVIDEYGHATFAKLLAPEQNREESDNSDFDSTSIETSNNDNQSITVESQANKQPAIEASSK